MISQLKKIRYFVEAFIVKLALVLFYNIGPKAASNLGSFLAKIIGTKLSVHKLAYRNLSNAIPGLSEDRKKEILEDMWDNLGRNVGEYPHIAKYSIDEIMAITSFSDETKANLELIKKLGKGGIVFSAHIGNWEIGPKLMMAQGFTVSTVYRPLNNPYVEKMTAKIRGTNLIEKTPAGSRKIIEAVKRGEIVMIMADQKVSEGNKVKFFHEDAITATSIARLALRYSIPLIPGRSIRVGKEFKFLGEVEKPLAFQATGDVNSDIIAITRQINSKLEEWITEYPAQWFWVHNRWKK